MTAENNSDEKRLPGDHEELSFDTIEEALQHLFGVPVNVAEAATRNLEGGQTNIVNWKTSAVGQTEVTTCGENLNKRKSRFLNIIIPRFGRK